MGIIVWLIVGFIAGALARLIMPGKDPMSWGMTLLLGLAGSIVGGLLASLIFGSDFGITSTGIIGSVIGALILLFAYRRVKAR